MTTLSLLKCCPLNWCELWICYDNTTMSASSLGTLCGLYNSCCSRSLCVGYLRFLDVTCFVALPFDPTG